MKGRRQPSAFEIRLYLDGSDGPLKMATDSARTADIESVQAIAPMLHAADVATVAAIADLLYTARALPLMGRVAPAGEEVLRQIEALRERIRRLADVVDDVHRGSR